MNKVKTLLGLLSQLISSVTSVNEEMYILTKIPSLSFATFHVRYTILLVKYMYNIVSIVIQIVMGTIEGNDISSVIRVDLKWTLAEFGEFLRNIVHLDLKIFSTSVYEMIEILAQIVSKYELFIFKSSEYIDYFVNGTGMC